MPLKHQCIVCARLLTIPRRSDARYCGSSCRVRAFRARRQPPTSQTSRQRAGWHLPNAHVATPGEATRTQLAAFRALRQAQKQTTELKAQLVQAQHQVTQVGAELAAFQTVAYAQQETIAQTTERLKIQRQHDAEFAAVFADLQGMTQLKESVYGQTLVQLEAALVGTNKQAATSEATHHAAEARAAVVRTELECRVSEAELQLEVEQQTAISLRKSLVEAEEIVESQRVQLDETALALSELRATSSRFVDVDKLTKVAAELSTANQLLTERTRERDKARQAVDVTSQVLQSLNQKLGTTEADLAKREALLMELRPKLEKAYAQLLLIKEKRDWRL